MTRFQLRSGDGSGILKLGHSGCPIWFSNLGRSETAISGCSGGPPVVSTVNEDDVGVFADERMVTGFAHLLGSIRLDLGFVRKVLVTEKALSLRSRSQDTVLRWVCAGKIAEVARNRGYVDWEGLYDLYLHWVRDYAMHSKPYDLTEFKERMRAHEIVGPKDEPRKVKVGIVSKTKRVPVFDKINPSQHGGEDESEDEVGADANVVGLANRSKWAEL